MAEAPTATTAQTNASRAVTTYDTMQRRFLLPDGTRLYSQTHPYSGGGNKYSYVWEFSRALLGTLALSGVPSSLVGGASYASAVQDRFTALERYWDASANPAAYDASVLSEGGGDKYHDDNAWVALAFIQRYRMGLTTSLPRAQQCSPTKPPAGTPERPVEQSPGARSVYEPVLLR